MKKLIFLLLLVPCLAFGYEPYFTGEVDSLTVEQRESILEQVKSRIGTEAILGTIAGYVRNRPSGNMCSIAWVSTNAGQSGPIQRDGTYTLPHPAADPFVMTVESPCYLSQQKILAIGQGEILIVNWELDENIGAYSVDAPISGYINNDISTQIKWSKPTCLPQTWKSMTVYVDLILQTASCGTSEEDLMYTAINDGSQGWSPYKSDGNYSMKVNYNGWSASGGVFRINAFDTEGTLDNVPSTIKVGSSFTAKANNWSDRDGIDHYEWGWQKGSNPFTWYRGNSSQIFNPTETGNFSVHMRAVDKLGCPAHNNHTRAVTVY